MKPTVTFVAALLLAAGAQAGDVYVTKDAKGNPVYTDTPVSIPAQKVNIANSTTDPAALQKRYSDEMNQYAKEDAQREQGGDCQVRRRAAAQHDCRGSRQALHGCPPALPGPRWTHAGCTRTTRAAGAGT